MRKNKVETLNFRLTPEQRAVLQPHDRPRVAPGQTERLEPSFRAWNAAFVDCGEPIPD